MILRLRDLLNSVDTRSRQNSEPKSDTANLHSSYKRRCEFGVSCCYTSPTFQMQESVFDQVEIVYKILD